MRKVDCPRYTQVDLGRDCVGCLQNVCVLPDSQHMPTGLLEESVGIPIPCSVGIELLLPPSCVALGNPSMHRTGMPKASVKEDRKLQSGKDDIDRTTASRKHLLMQTIPQASRMNRPPNGHFKPSVARPDSLVPRAVLLASRGWSGTQGHNKSPSPALRIPTIQTSLAPIHQHQRLRIALLAQRGARREAGGFGFAGGRRD